MEPDELTPELPGLDPSVRVSQDNEHELPLHSFDLLIVVEPDPESWIIPATIYGWAEEVNENLSAEFGRAAESKGGLPLLVWIRTYDIEPVLTACAEDVRLVLLPGPEIGDEGKEIFEDLLRGLHSRMPSAKAAIAGAALENEVVSAANICVACGLSTTILTRYCLSHENFIDIDAVQQEADREQIAHRVLTGEAKESVMDRLFAERAQYLAAQPDLDLSSADFDRKLFEILKGLKLEVAARVEIVFTDPDDPEENAGPAIHFWDMLEPGALTLFHTTAFGGDWHLVRWQAWEPGQREEYAEVNLTEIFRGSRCYEQRGSPMDRPTLCGTPWELPCRYYAPCMPNNSSTASLIWVIPTRVCGVAYPTIRQAEAIEPLDAAQSLCLGAVEQMTQTIVKAQVCETVDGSSFWLESPSAAVYAIPT